MPSEQPKIDDGGPAFPHPQGWRRDPEVSDGMTLRDYFAGQALAGVSADSTAPMGCDKDRERIAVWCYQIADAMLKARST